LAVNYTLSGVERMAPNSAIDALTSAAWDELARRCGLEKDSAQNVSFPLNGEHGNACYAGEDRRAGDRFIVQLLLHHTLLQPLDNDCFLQLSGARQS